MKCFIYSIFIFLLFSCNLFKKKTVKTESIEVKKEKKYLYNLNIDSLHVFTNNIQNGESVGKILSNYNISFSDIDKIAKLSRSMFDLRDVKASNKYSLLFEDSLLSNPLYFIYEINSFYIMYYYVF